MTTKTYDSNEVSVTLGGYDIASGRADGDFVTTKRNAELFTRKVGADGEVTRSKTNDRSGTIEIKLMQTSEGHALLEQLYAQAQAAVNGDDIMEFQLRDRSGGLIESAEECWIEKGPDNAFGKEAGDRTWVLACADLVREVE